MPAFKSLVKSIRTRRSQQYKFAYEAMNTLFQKQQQDFITYLKRDGTKFLQFWWDRVGLDVDESIRAEPKGLGFTFRTLADGREIVIIILPLPVAEPEPYFLACIPSLHKQSRFTPWKNNPRIVSLEYRMAENGMIKTRLCEWTVRYNHIDIAEGCEPDLDRFFELVQSLYPVKS